MMNFEEGDKIIEIDGLMRVGYVVKSDIYTHIDSIRVIFRPSSFISTIPKKDIILEKIFIRTKNIRYILEECDENGVEKG